MSDIYNWFLEVTDEIKEKAFNAAENAAEMGVEAMRETIRTNGAKAQWTGDWSYFQDREGKPRRDGSHPGRVHTGTMIEAVDKKVERSKDHMKVEFGWVDPGSYQEYFQHQEYGFRNVLAGVTVEGMNALNTGALVAGTELGKGLK